MDRVEQQAGVSYDDARKGHDQQYNQSVDPQQNPQAYAGDTQSNVQAYNQYQQAAQQVHGGRANDAGRWDSVAECYMLNGPDLRTIPWHGDPETEIDAFVSEELYIHSKLLIADDRTVICGSANLNDRSQLGDHDSEIVIVIQDPAMIDSAMAGRPWKASVFAASLRRQIFRKHLGLVPPQDYETPDANYFPVGTPNVYDWGSREDHAVADPLSESFAALWKTTASNNTQAFAKVFRPVPDDAVQNWKQYDEYFARYFKADDDPARDQGRPSTWKLGHVVREEFSPGAQGAREVKEVLSRVKVCFFFFF